VPKYSTRIKDWGAEKIVSEIKSRLGIEITEDKVSFALQPNVIIVELPRELTKDELEVLYEILEQDERVKRKAPKK